MLARQGRIASDAFAREGPNGAALDVRTVVIAREMASRKMCSADRDADG